MSLVEFVSNAGASLPPIDGSTRIYKDECMYSFDTAENNPLGLDVCMSCFQAFSRTAHRNYTQQHYSLKRHALFVNITKRLKSQDEQEASGRQLKLPKLEIVEQKELDVYDVSYLVYVAPKDALVAIDQTSAHVQKAAQDLINANSASLNDDIKAWEHEVLPCEHSLCIDPVAAKSPDLTTCGLCDLKENLWMCLSCGTVACGREQFGSTLKGNSHALAHASSSGHHVAVKLGSLSADNEDSCDCYCYQCNDEVKVPHLAEKLLAFGVDLASAVKSEKSLVEMNLDTNKSWQFNLEGDDGERLVPVFGPGLTGMQNLGNSCYLNSVLQALFSFEAYHDFYEGLDFDLKVPNASTDLKSQMIKLYDGLWSGRYSKPNVLKGDEYQTGIRPTAFKTLIGADHAEFKTNKQQDANEFLLYLFDRLDKEYGLSLNEKFKFLTSSKVVCTECHTGSSTISLVDNLSVPIASDVIDEQEGVKTYRRVQLEESFDGFNAEEKIENYQCDACGKVCTATKREGFRTYPQNLIVNVQRIALENWVPVKREVPIAVPEQIDLAAYRAPTFSEGEVVLDTNEAQEERFVANQEAMSMLLSMGFSEPRCMRGLYNTGNASSEDAMNWIFAHMEDADIDQPFEPTPQKTSAGASPEAVNGLVAMGFSEMLATKALVLNQGDANAAVEWLFSHPDDDGVIQNTTPAVNLKEESKSLKSKLLQQQNDLALYDLKAVVCHKGSSPHTGHYVVFIKEQGNDWVLFNDEKVVRCGAPSEDMQKSGYIYFFQKH